MAAAASPTRAPLESTADASAQDTNAAPARPVRPQDGPLRFLAVGGGPTPESTEVSLEQDIALVGEVLPPPGEVLFAGGSHSASVRELNPGAGGGDPVRLALGDLLQPRPGRHSRYRTPRFRAERATLSAVRARVDRALSTGTEPLTLYVAAHGEQGASARDNTVVLWGGDSLSVAELAAWHESHTRPLRLVATSCFSGGFAELAFAGADARTRRAPRVARCGVFAGTEDRETSGCDPNPDRRAQESYGLHLLLALSGKTKSGAPLAGDRLDFDHDGKIGLLDAHTWARIHARSFDVPTTTSERWLRAVEPKAVTPKAALVPEEVSVIEQLGKDLELASEQQAKLRWQALRQSLDQLQSAAEERQVQVSAHAQETITRLLERWPTLDDPFHPEFEESFRRHRDAIEQELLRSRAAEAQHAEEQALEALYGQLERLGVEEARVMRLLRAYETAGKATNLLARGGKDAETYRRLVSCERAPL